METRQERLMPNGTPRYIRLYDNGGETVDRYTCVFIGNYKGGKMYLGMSSDPFHPMGVGIHGESEELIDRPSHLHLGKKVPFDSIPEKVKTCVISTYKSIWNLK